MPVFFVREFELSPAIIFRLEIPNLLRIIYKKCDSLQKYWNKKKIFWNHEQAQTHLWNGRLFRCQTIGTNVLPNYIFVKVHLNF